MRDLILVGIVGIALLGVLRQPVWGAYLWAWFSLLNPHRLTYGFAFSLPFAQAIAALTVLMWMFTRDKKAIPLTAVTGFWVAVLLWMSLTSLFALNHPDLVRERWIFVAKIQLMLAITLMLVIEPKHLKALVVIVTLSVAFYGVKGGVHTVLTAGGGRVWGPQGSLLEGNNELAVGLVMVMPFLFWMRQCLVRNKWLKHALLLSLVLCALSVLGSQSRGAFLAIVAMALFLGLKSGKPVLMTSLLALGLVVAVAFMPDTWSERMDTIGAYKQDESAMSRIWTWTTLWNVAVDRPLVGAGFRADAHIVFRTYSPQGEQWAVFDNVVYVAHSIYFQMLGEHGFVGLALFLGMWAATWRTAGRVAKQATDMSYYADWLPLMMRMTQVSLIGYLVGGAFLSLAYLDLAYYFLAYVVIAHRLVRDAQNPQASSAVVGHGAVQQVVTRGS